MKPHRKNINKFVDPIIEEALAKNSKGEEKADLENGTLLDHLVSQTQGL